MEMCIYMSIGLLGLVQTSNFSCTEPLIMYIFTTLEFPTHYSDFHLMQMSLDKEFCSFTLGLAHENFNVLKRALLLI